MGAYLYLIEGDRVYLHIFMVIPYRHSKDGEMQLCWEYAIIFRDYLIEKMIEN